MSRAMLDAISSELFKEIADAFPPRILEESLFSGPGGAWDVYAELGFGFEEAYGQTWETLDPGFVERHGGALRYMAPDGFVATIPAYLVALIRGTQNEMPVLVLGQLWGRPGFEEKFDVRLARLSAEQRWVIAHVLCVLGDTDLVFAEEIAPALAVWRPMLG